MVPNVSDWLTDLHDNFFAVVVHDPGYKGLLLIIAYYQSCLANSLLINMTLNPYDNAVVAKRGRIPNNNQFFTSMTRSLRLYMALPTLTRCF